MNRKPMYPTWDFDVQELHPGEVGRFEPERRRCNDCGEEWVDPGHAVCIFCQSEDTELIEDD